MKLKNIKVIKSLRNFFYVFILFFVTESCNNSSDYQVKIYGKITGGQGKNIILESLMPNRVDTLIIEKINPEGEFELLVKNMPGGFFRLVIDNNNTIYLFARKNQEIEIFGKYPNLVRNYTVNGSEDSKLLRQMNLRLIESSDKLNVLKNEIKEASMQPDCNIDSLLLMTNDIAQNLYEADKKYLKEFIEKNSTSPAIYMALYQYVGTSPILTLQNDLCNFEFVLEKLKEHNPDFPHIDLLESAINTKKLQDKQVDRDYLNLTIGTEAPDFCLNNQIDEKHCLTEFQGRKIIVGFWASWNEKSIENMISLKSYSEKYDVKIVLISLDVGKEKWENAIYNNKIDNFSNYCDFKSWEGSVVKIYGVKNLPSYVLINEKFEIEEMTIDVNVLKDKL